jgi:hypothetical protein
MSFIKLLVIIFLLSGYGLLHATPIQSGADVTGSISPSDPSDSYTIEAPAGAAIRVGMGILSGDAQPRVEILSPTGDSLASNSPFSGKGINAYVTAPSTGTYTVRVSDSGNNEAATYRISVVVAPATIAESDDNRLLVASGSELEGALTVGDFDVFTVQAPAGAAIRVGLGFLTGFALPQLEIISPTGTSLDLRSPFSGQGVAASATAPSTGAYTILVSDLGNNDAATYRLSVVVAPATIAESDDNRLLVASGSDLEGALTVGDFDVFTVQASAGASIRVGLGFLTGFALPQLEIISPTGTSLDVRSPFSGPGTNAYVTAPITGTYTILVSDLGNNDAATYRLSVVVAPSSRIARASNTVLANGVGVTATLERGDFDMHVFGGVAGDTVGVMLSQISSNGFNALFELVSPSGEAIEFRGVGSYPYVLQETGTYTLLVWDSGSDASGTYTLSASGFTGTANVTFVSPAAVPPKLTITRLPDGSVEVSWPLSPTGWVLQSSISLDPRSFNDRNTQADASGNFLLITSPVAKEFFRLRN